eukprot:15433430-Alexandrium_andersonii.AAC.2
MTNTCKNKQLGHHHTSQVDFSAWAPGRPPKINFSGSEVESITSEPEKLFEFQVRIPVGTSSVNGPPPRNLRVT